MKRGALAVLVLVATLASIFAASHLDLSRDLTALFPHTPEAEALARVTRIFGGGDAAFVLVRGDDPDEVTAAASEVADLLRRSASVEAVLEGPPALPKLAAVDAWRYAGPRARARLEEALTEQGMRTRLRETRALLLAPGASELASLVEEDPLRLAAIPWEGTMELAAGARGVAGGAFVTDGGRARLVLAAPRGRAFEGAEAERFVVDAERALGSVRARHPRVRVELTGGHVVARQTEQLVRGDLERSGVLSLLLASVVFVVTFRRPRALLAVLPPLVAGTLWTMGLASVLYPRLSAIATGFTAVVVGVGVDTGVHVYGRLLEARRDGLAPRDAARVARRETTRPALGAAIAAGGAFGCLVLSDVDGMRQLGVLCAAGEVLTAVAILLVVPEVGAWLERGAPPPPLRLPLVARATATRGRAVAVLALAALTVVLAGTVARPRFQHDVVKLDGRTLPALATYEAIYAAFGGTRGQLLVVSADADEGRARARADAVTEAAEQLAAEHAIDGFDALGTALPSDQVVRMRLAARDRLDLPAKARLLERLLDEEGFDRDAFAPAVRALADANTSASANASAGTNAWVERRHLGHDADGTVVVTFVRPVDDPRLQAHARAVLQAADPSAVLTSYADLERGLAATLAHDLPRILALAAGLVVVSVAWANRSVRAVLLALAVLGVEIALVLVAAHVLGIRWHLYDALVLPVLLGITLDEALFLLGAAARRSVDDALTTQAPLGTATALTTAAGFVALVACRFPGLADLGKVGALGSTVGLVSALLVIPAGLRLTRLRNHDATRG